MGSPSRMMSAKCPKSYTQLWLDLREFYITLENDLEYAITDCADRERSLDALHASFLLATSAIDSMDKNNEVNLCKYYIKKFTALTRSPNKSGSYYFKHRVEKAVGAYIAEDSFIEALKQLDIPTSKRKPNTKSKSIRPYLKEIK